MQENTSVEKWSSWLQNARYSSWQSSVIPYDGNGKILRTPKLSTRPVGSSMLAWKDRWTDAPYLEGLSGPRPDRLIKNAHGSWRMSHKLDTGDVGNHNLFGVIGGTSHLEDQPDLSRIMKLCGPSKRDIPLSLPHYDLTGPFELSLVESTRVVLCGCTYKINETARTVLFRDMPVQHLRRLEGTSIIVSSAENEEIRISVVSFAPFAPELSFICRVFIAERLVAESLKELTIHQLAVNSHKTWDITTSGQFCHFIDKNDATGFSLFSPDFVNSKNATLLQGNREEEWQQADVALHAPIFEPSRVAVSWSLLIPRIKGGDPEESRALETAPEFAPWENLNATRERWESWSQRTILKSDNSFLDGLMDSLQVLLKTHEGKLGLHTGSSYQRHTHCWCRDNYMMQRGLLSAGRIEEADVNFRGFVAAWRDTGISNAYHIHTHAPWSPKPTTEVCAYLILMARDMHLWTGQESAHHGTWEMIQQCADGIHANSLGLIGFDGDEIWIWELEEAMLAGTQIDEYAVLDNCWLAITALEYAERIATARGFKARANQWGTKKQKITAAVEEKLWDPARRRYSSFLYPDGKRFSGLLVNGLCTPCYIGIEEVRPGSFAAGINACGSELMSPEDIVRGNSLTDVYAGLSPAFYLHGLGSIGSYKTGDAYLQSLLRALPSSGAPWEYSVVDCPVSSYDKRRPADSGVLLTTLIHYLTGYQPDWDGFTLRPHLPTFCSNTVSIQGLRFHQHTLSLVLDKSGTQASLDQRKLQFIPTGSELKWNSHENKEAISRSTLPPLQ